MKEYNKINDKQLVKKTKKTNDKQPVKKTTKNIINNTKLVENLEYKDELIKERINKLVKIAKQTIRNRIFDEDKRIASNSEIENIYKTRLNIYKNSIQKSSNGIATGGPISK